MRVQEIQQGLAGAVLGQMLDRVFEIDDNGVGAGGQGLGNAVRPVGGHEQRGSDD